MFVKWGEKLEDRIKLYKGDCLEIMKDIPDKSIDMILCDLPYNITRAKWDIPIPFEKLWEQYERMIKDDGVIALFGAEPFASKLRLSNEKLYRYDWYWEKDKGTNFGSCHKQPLRKVETISIFYKKQPYYVSQGEKLEKPYRHSLPQGKSKLYGDFKYDSSVERVYVTRTHKTKTNLVYFARDNAGKGVHSCQKPVKLLEYLILCYTNENDVILDNTMGSGSTGVACKNINRKFIGIEQDEKYFDIAYNRINGYIYE